MKNIVLTIVFALTLGQIALAQSSGDRKPSSPTDRGNRSGIGAKSGPKGSTQGQNEESVKFSSYSKMLCMISTKGISLLACSIPYSPRSG